jgi:hypothetical protein
MGLLLGAPLYRREDPEASLPLLRQRVAITRVLVAVQPHLYLAVLVVTFPRVCHELSTDLGSGATANRAQQNDLHQDQVVQELGQ